MQNQFIAALLLTLAVTFPAAAQSPPLGVPTNIPEPGYSTHGCMLPSDHTAYGAAPEEYYDDVYYNDVKTYIDCVKMYKANAEEDLKTVQDAINRSDEEITAADAILARRTQADD